MRSKGKISLKIAAIVVVVILAISVGAYFLMTQRPQKKGVVLRVITRHGYDILDKTKELFLKSKIAKEYNIVDIVWLPIDPGQWIEIIKSSGQKPGKEIDVAWGGGPTLFDYLAYEGLLKPMNSTLIKEVLKEIPGEINGAPLIRRNEKGEIIWIAAAISSFGFTINTKVISELKIPEPKSWIDLANETFAVYLPDSKVGVACPTRSTSNTRMYEIILQIYGWKKGWIIITLMGANSKIFGESGLVRDAVIRGDIAVGITIDFYGYTAQIQNPNCKYVMPDDGTIINGDPIALLVTSKHPKEAQAFIAWVLSAEGQKVWLDKNINRLPANPKVFGTPEGKEREDIKRAYEETLSKIPIGFSDELALSYENAMRWFFYATITDAHSKLQEAWMLIVEAKQKEKIDRNKFIELIEELADPTKLVFTDPATGKSVTFTQEYAQSINTKLVKDVDYRNKLLKVWKESAINRYEKIISEVKAIIGGG
ncbi:MAG: ABC transporter substrate-binding protein [Thermoprotei archaeon]|nr:MAG: ABC transporter substrate-binding protein [Thermoprotei archaeon]